jgi:hypothetical protein
MFKLINIAGDELRLDDKGVSQMVTNACARAGVYVEGIAVGSDSVTLVCSDNSRDGQLSYRFTSLGGNAAAEDVFAELRCRYDNNFRTVGAFALADGYWTLTEKTLTE